MGCAEREPFAAAFRPPPVARLVRHDREQPGTKRRAAAEARQRPPGLRQPELGCILGVGGIAGDQVCGAESDLLVVAGKRGEGGGITVTCTLDELVLCRWSAHHSWVLHHPAPAGSSPEIPVVTRDAEAVTIGKAEPSTRCPRRWMTDVRDRSRFDDRRRIGVRQPGGLHLPRPAAGAVRGRRAAGPRSRRRPVRRHLRVHAADRGTGRGARATAGRRGADRAPESRLPRDHRRARPHGRRRHLLQRRCDHVLARRRRRVARDGLRTGDAGDDGAGQ